MKKMMALIPFLFLYSCGTHIKGIRFERDFFSPTKECKCEDDVTVAEVDMHFGPGPGDDVEAEPEVARPKERKPAEPTEEKKSGWWIF